MSIFRPLKFEPNFLFPGNQENLSTVIQFNSFSASLAPQKPITKLCPLSNYQIIDSTPRRELECVIIIFKNTHTHGVIKILILITIKSTLVQILWSSNITSQSAFGYKQQKPPMDQIPFQIKYLLSKVSFKRLIFRPEPVSKYDS